MKQFEITTLINTYRTDMKVRDELSKRTNRTI